MFSTIPRIGIPVLRQNVTSLLTSDIATPWGGGGRKREGRERGRREEEGGRRRVEKQNIRKERGEEGRERRGM